jgi:hypothetical protein
MSFMSFMILCAERITEAKAHAVPPCFKVAHISADLRLREGAWGSEVTSAEEHAQASAWSQRSEAL